MLGFHRDPLGFLRAGQVEFGDVFTIPLRTAPGPAGAAAGADVPAGHVLVPRHGLLARVA